MLPHQLLLDGWLTLVTGREVVSNGLPTVDTLTVWTQGVAWIDQQWLAQAAFYGLWALGGIKLVMLGQVVLVAATVALALVGARRLGGSPRNVALVGAVAVLVAPWAIQMRTQSLVMPLFVVVLWLLADDSRTPSRRVFLVFPLLALWANLHGTVVLAALFVALRGVTYRRLRGLAEAARLAAAEPVAHARAVRVRARVAVRARARRLLPASLPQLRAPRDRAGVGREHADRVDGAVLPPRGRRRSGSWHDGARG